MVRKDDVLKQFGSQLAEVRKKKNLSIGQLAALTGIQETQLARIEEGKINVLFSTMLILSEALGVQPHQLLE